MPISEALKDYLDGKRLTAAEITKRRDTCLACKWRGSRIGLKKKFPFIGRQDICTACGCYLEGALGKINAPREKCPKNNW